MTARQPAITPAEIAACARQERFEGFHRAMAAADRVRRATLCSTGVLSCRVCGGWHLTGRAAG